MRRHTNRTGQPTATHPRRRSQGFDAAGNGASSNDCYYYYGDAADVWAIVDGVASPRVP